MCLVIVLLHWLHQKIINFNLFERYTPRTPSNIFREQLLTRIFLILISIFSIAAGFDIFFVVQSQVRTISEPSSTVYQELYIKYPDTLQCHCSQVSIPYENFLNVTFILHEVCSSDYVSLPWLNYPSSYDPSVLVMTGLLFDFRTTGISYFEFLATFCSLSKSHIDDAYRVFSNTQLINDHMFLLHQSLLNK
jgi:hypothetical protein